MKRPSAFSGVHAAGLRGRGGAARRGQAMLESFLVILVISLLLFGLLQVAVLFNAREVLHHAAARAARARSVGFNAWMVRKAQRVAAIPNSGALLEPLLAAPPPLLRANRSLGENWDDALDLRRPLPRSERVQVEQARIPEYLASENAARAAYVLQYEEWERDSFQLSETGGTAFDEDADTVRTRVRQWFPLRLPFHRAFYAPPVDAAGVSRISLSGESELIHHYPLYLEDRQW